MKGHPAQGEEQEKWATSGDYALIVQTILEKRAASAESCDKTIAMLEKQQCTRRISRYLPQREGIRWGSKTGSAKGVTNDAGFITTPEETLIVSVFRENLPDQHVGEQVIGDISRVAMKVTGVVEPLHTSTELDFPQSGDGTKRLGEAFHEGAGDFYHLRVLTGHTGMSNVN